MTPLVSVIIPAYNQARYLPLTLKCVEAQTYSDWEIVLVNDGSTDNTATVALAFGDSRLNYIVQNNQGLSAARNTGVRAARGEYLAFLDADDEWESRFLERCVTVATADPAKAGVYTRNKYIDQDGCVLPDIGGKVVAPSQFRRRLLEGGFFPPNASLVKTSIVRQVGLFDTQLTSVEDWDLWLRISERWILGALEEPLACYRIYAGSMSTNAARMHANRITALSKYFGPPVDDPHTWPEDKRIAYGFAYRSASLGYLQQEQLGIAWQHLKEGAIIWPGLLMRLDTIYEMASGNKPWGYRGQISVEQARNNSHSVIENLTQLLSEPRLHHIRRAAFGHAYWSLGMLSERAGQWSTARGYLLKALQAQPRLIVDYSFMRRLLKILAGPQIVNVLRKTSKT